eukprot:364846-Chlamydomonas_euryale.AAC.8
MHGTMWRTHATCVAAGAYDIVRMHMPAVAARRQRRRCRGLAVREAASRSGRHLVWPSPGVAGVNAASWNDLHLGWPRFRPATVAPAGPDSNPAHHPQGRRRGLNLTTRQTSAETVVQANNFCTLCSGITLVGQALAPFASGKSRREICGIRSVGNSTPPSAYAAQRSTARGRDAAAQAGRRAPMHGRHAEDRPASRRCGHHTSRDHAFFSNTKDEPRACVRACNRRAASTELRNAHARSFRNPLPTASSIECIANHVMGIAHPASFTPSMPRPPLHACLSQSQSEVKRRMYVNVRQVLSQSHSHGRGHSHSHRKGAHAWTFQYGLHACCNIASQRMTQCMRQCDCSEPSSAALALITIDFCKILS